MPYRSSGSGGLDRPDPDEIVEADVRRTRRRGLSWRTWLGLGFLVFALLSCPLAVAFLITYFHNPADTSNRVSTFVDTLLTTLTLAVPVGAVLLLLLLTRNLWMGLIARPVHARDDRFPALVNWRGQVRMIDNQNPRLPHLHSIQQGGLPPGLFDESTAPNEVAGLLDAPEMSLIPKRGEWSEVRAEIRPNHYFLGWTLDGPLWADLETVLTMFAAGQQGFGKTSLARSLVLQAALTGVEVVIWDWFNDIAREASGAFPHVYTDPEDVEASARDILSLMMTRQKQWIAGQHEFPELLIAADEWIQYEKKCAFGKQVIKDGLDSGRKLGIRFYVSSVRLPAGSVGEALSKGNVATVFVFNTSAQAASQFEITGKRAEALLSALFRAGKGYCIVRSARLQQEGTILALPFISPELFQAELARLRLPPSSLPPLRRQSSAWVMPLPDDPPPAQPILPPMRHKITGAVMQETPLAGPLDPLLFPHPDLPPPPPPVAPEPAYRGQPAVIPFSKPKKGGVVGVGGQELPVPETVTPEQYRRFLELRGQGMSITAIRVKLSPSSDFIYRVKEMEQFALLHGHLDLETMGAPPDEDQAVLVREEEVQKHVGTD